MTDILYRKLAAWPQRDTADRKSRYVFSVGYANTLKHIEDELDKINATDIVLEGFIPTNKIRRDGWPLSDTPAIHPGLRLSWQSRLVGPGELMTDEYATWPANLRAIGLTLEALRAVGRYGTMTKKQQYKGLLAEPPPKPANLPPQKVIVTGGAGVLASAEEAAGFLSCFCDFTQARILEESLIANQAYRAASLLLHPDPGGDHERFVRLQQAKDLLNKHHKDVGAKERR